MPERPNLQRALKQVRQNKGAPGIDGMSVDELPRYLKENWLEIRDQLIAGTSARNRSNAWKSQSRRIFLRLLFAASMNVSRYFNE